MHPCRFSGTTISCYYCLCEWPYLHNHRGRERCSRFRFKVVLGLPINDMVFASSRVRGTAHNSMWLIVLQVLYRSCFQGHNLAASIYCTYLSTHRLISPDGIIVVADMGQHKNSVTQQTAMHTHCIAVCCVWGCKASDQSQCLCWPLSTTELKPWGGMLWLIGVYIHTDVHVVQHQQ